MIHRKSTLALLILAILFSPSLFAQRADFDVDSVLQQMSLEEKIGQLFMVAAYSNKDQAHLNELERLVREQHIGGVIVMQGGPGRQIHMLSKLQSAARVPLLVGQDAEWGQAMRLDSTYKFPTSLTVGAAGSEQAARDLGAAMARECSRVGVHISFSPVLDVNTNAANPIIGARSFGSDPQGVSAMGAAVTAGFQSEGVLACGKHFPGHGDTHQDSHKTLPKVDRSLAQLEAVEWVPFKKAVEAGVDALMIAHLNIPSLEPSGKPTSLSRTVIEDILRKKWGYDGLVITDALNMRGVSEFAPPGQLEIAAFQAGNDILLFPMDVPKASKSLLEAFQSGALSTDELDRRVRRILRAKAESRAITDWRLAKSNALAGSLAELAPENQTNERICFTLVRDAITALERGTASLPVQNVQQNFAHVALGDAPEVQTLNDYLDRYAEMPHAVGTQSTGWKSADAVIVSFHQDTKNPWRRYKLSDAEVAFLRAVAQSGKPLYILHFANPYGVLTYPELGPGARVLIAYENDRWAQMLLPQFLFGARETRGTLPVDLGPWGNSGSGLQTQGLQRLSYGLPFEVGVDAAPLKRIDSTMIAAIAARATPGGQVLVARRGMVIYDQSFGQHTYGGKEVNWRDLYDVASVTKITATLPGVMRWYEKQPLLLKTTLGNHTDRLDGSDKKYLVFEDVLAHQSGLEAWIPFYVYTQRKAEDRAYWYSTTPQEGYVEIQPGMYLRETVRDTMFAMLARSDLKAREYRYSDLGYYLFQEMLEERFNEPLDQWVRASFYLPLGAKRLTYNPLDHGFALDEIVPTEEDTYWRKGLVHGRVHDMGAAMLGGVAGHAGIFANANDLAKMMQMYLNGGSYGGIQFFQPETVQLFSACAFCEVKNRRGLGFDRPQLEEGPGPSCTCASDLSFGHTGFTGTMVWMDPESELLYIFLSNRTYPDGENWKLSRMDVRTNIQSYLYDALH